MVPQIPCNGFMYSADADGRGRTRTFYFYLKKKKIGIHISTGPIGARPRVRPLGSPPPPISKLYEHYAQIPGWLSTRTGNLQFD